MPALFCCIVCKNNPHRKNGVKDFVEATKMGGIALDFFFWQYTNVLRLNSLRCSRNKGFLDLAEGFSGFADEEVIIFLAQPTFAIQDLCKIHL
jgi:hypothetical protein